MDPLAVIVIGLDIGPACAGRRVDDRGDVGHRVYHVFDFARKVTVPLITDGLACRFDGRRRTARQDSRILICRKVEAIRTGYAGTRRHDCFLRPCCRQCDLQCRRSRGSGDAVRIRKSPQRVEVIPGGVFQEILFTDVVLVIHQPDDSLGND